MGIEGRGYGPCNTTIPLQQMMATFELVSRSVSYSLVAQVSELKAQPTVMSNSKAIMWVSRLRTAIVSPTCVRHNPDRLSVPRGNTENGDPDTQYTNYEDLHTRLSLLLSPGLQMPSFQRQSSTGDLPQRFQHKTLTPMPLDLEALKGRKRSTFITVVFFISASEAKNKLSDPPVFSGTNNVKSEH